MPQSRKHQHLYLTSGYSVARETVPRIEPSIGFQTLGVYLTPSSSQLHQAKVLREISDRYYNSISSVPLSPDKAFLSYTMFLRPKLTYPLPCSTLSEVQCRKIQAPALVGLLPELKFNRHTPRAVLCGGFQLGGLQIPELYTD